MVVMNTANIRFSVNGTTIHDGVAMPGMFHVTEPGAQGQLPVPRRLTSFCICTCRMR